MKIEELYRLFLKSTGVCTDTRKIIPGCMFFALKGDNFDGNKFATSALKNGASYTIIDNPEYNTEKNCILVKNVLQTLQNLATHHRIILGLPIIAITGTNGKTTTKELTSTLLSQKYQVSFTQGNLNNHIGVPLTLLSMDSKTELGVVEMGANHLGEIKELCEIARPNFGLITNIGKAHLEGFGSLEGVKKTKSELYRYLEENNGRIFLNGENDVLIELAGTKLLSTLYNGSNSNIKGNIDSSDPYIKVKAQICSEKLTISTQLIGEYNLENILAALTIGNYFKVDNTSIKKALEEYSPGNNRSQLINKGSNQIIMDAYNANPSSMQTSINNFLSLRHPNKIAILGDMLELGTDSLMEHQHIIDTLKNQAISKIYLVGTNFHQTIRSTKIITFVSTSELIDHLKDHPIKDSLCLIKGSRGIKLEEILDIL